MKTFTEKVKKICERSLNPEFIKISLLKEEKTSILEKLEKLSDLSIDELNFIKKEKKLELLENFNIPILLEKLYNNISQFSSLPSFPYLINMIKRDYTFKLDTKLSIFERITELLKNTEYIEISKSLLLEIESIKETLGDDTILIKKYVDDMNNLRDNGIYNNIREKLNEYLEEEITKKNLIETLKQYSYEPFIRNMINGIKKTLSENDLIINNNNRDYVVENIYSFIYFDQDNKNKHYFANNGLIFEKDGNDIKPMSRFEITKLPEFFVKKSELLSYPNVHFNNDCINIDLNGNLLNFCITNEGKKACINGKDITNENIIPFIVKLGLDGVNKIHNYGTLQKIWEDLETILEIDFGKNIKSNKDKGVQAAVYKVDETFTIHIINPLMKINEIITDLTAMQARTFLLEQLDFDIYDSLYEYMQNDIKILGELKNRNKHLILNLDDLYKNLNNINSVLLEEEFKDNNELLQLKSIIEDEINNIKEDLNQVNISTLDMQQASNKKTIDTINPEELSMKIFKINQNVKIKNSEIIGKVIGVNTNNKKVSVLLNNGISAEFSFKDVEIIPYSKEPTNNIDEGKKEEMKKLEDLLDIFKDKPTKENWKKVELQTVKVYGNDISKDPDLDDD